MGNWLMIILCPVTFVRGIFRETLFLFFSSGYTAKEEALEVSIQLFLSSK